MTDRDAPLPSSPRPSRRRPRRGDVATYRIRVDLEHASPPIWRRLDVRSDIGLDAFHQVLQAAFAWTDSHLHRFALGDSVFDRDAETFLCPYDAEEGDDGLPAEGVHLDETLTEPGDLLRYCYDYGDSWDLTIALESINPLGHPLSDAGPAATCVDGRRAAPPEDCGGLRDAVDLAGVLDDPAHFDLADINRALTSPYMQLLDIGANPRLVHLLNRLRETEMGDELVTRVVLLAQPTPAAFQLAEKSTALRPFLWFLDRVGDDGLPLTSAGYLKPTDVTAAAAVVPDAVEWIGTKNRESQTYPVLFFRESMQDLGLLRKYRGRLLLTKAGAAARGNPEQLWRHIADRLPLGKDQSVDAPAGLLALVLAASSPNQTVSLRLVAPALNHIGWRHADGRPVTADAAGWATSATLGVLENITTGPRGFRQRNQISAAAAELARKAIMSPHRTR